jgi:hypothetical protein
MSRKPAILEEAGFSAEREAPTMNAPDGPVWFVGDLDDPWVGAIADAVPGGVLRHSCAGELPECLFRNLPPPRALVLHRAALSSRDAGWLARLRGGPTVAPRVILCVGPHARHADLERWSSLLDVVVPEATARETIARHVAEGGERTRPSVPRPRISVVSGHYELRQALADVVAAAGYSVVAVSRWSEATPVGPAVWDVPVLETDWTRGMARRARLGSVVALLGFADRALVRQARAHGASACLELPCDPADLIWALDRLAVRRVEPAHDMPPPPVLASRPTGRRALDTSARRVHEPPDATRPVVSFPRGGRPRPRGLQ